MSTTPQTPGEGAWFPYYLGVLAGQKLPGMDEVVAGLDVIRLRPGHVLFDIGEPHNYMYLVRKGTLKISTFGARDRESIIAFCRPPEMVASLLGLSPQGLRRVSSLPPTMVKARALTGLGHSRTRATVLQGCELERFDFRVLEDMMDRYAAWGVAVANAALLHAAIKERRERELLTLNPEERYRRFLEDYNDLLGLVTQRDIASYVGVTAVGMNRIVKRVGPVEEDFTA